MNPAQAVAALGRITTELEELFALLAPVASGFARVAGLELPSHEDLIDFRGAIGDVLAHSGDVGGAGVIVAPGLLVDAPYWMEWWWAVPRREPETLRVNLEPSAPDFFDYTTAEWYDVPERTGRRQVAGPYVDYVCRNDYALTLSQPVRAAGTFVGVAALDLPASRFERRILPILASLDGPATLVNEANRVIASTSPAVWPGQCLPASSDDLAAAASEFGWQILG